MSNLLEYLLALHRKRSRTVTNHQEMATNNHQLMPILLCCSKPSRWRQPPRVIRKSWLKRSPSATRCNPSSKCTKDHSQSHYDDQSMEDVSGRCLLKLTRMYGLLKCPTSIYRASQRIEPLCPFIWVTAGRLYPPVIWTRCTDGRV
jgi:hypothetical protein